MISELVGKISILTIVVISLTETVYYKRGYGMNFRIYAPEDENIQWFISKPNKLQRKWLLIAILSKLILVSALGFLVFM